MAWHRRNPTKMGNQETQGFASKREYKRYLDLLLLEKIGKIKELRTQVKYELTPKCGKERASHYVADFVYFEDGQQVVEDSKGHRTVHYILKRKFLLYRYGISIRET